MDAAAPPGKKKYQPKARILVEREEGECAVETCMDSIRELIELIGFSRRKDEHTWADVESTAWEWVN